jgi:glucuronosyltransferase
MIASIIQRFKELVENHDRLVLMSFGSVANASLMPADWKAAFLGAFRRFPEYQFLLRYDINDLDAKLPANVHTFKWLPQRDLMRTFISRNAASL